MSWIVSWLDIASFVQTYVLMTSFQRNHLFIRVFIIIITHEARSKVTFNMHVLEGEASWGWFNVSLGWKTKIFSWNSILTTLEMCTKQYIKHCWNVWVKNMISKHWSYKIKFTVSALMRKFPWPNVKRVWASQWGTKPVSDLSPNFKPPFTA